MIVSNNDGSFKGIITILGRRYFFEICETKDSFNNLYTFSADWRLIKLLGPSLNSFLDNEFRDVQHLHDRLTDFANSCVKDEIECEDWLKNPLDACTLVKTIQKDIEKNGEYIKFIDIGKRIVNIEVTDMQFRVHKAVLKLGQGYPKEAIKVLYHNLPQIRTMLGENANDFNGMHSVGEFCKKFKQLVNNFQDFWNIMAVVDTNYWVLDPPNPTHKDVFRRIKISDTFSFALTLNPLMPRQIPDIKFFGCQSDVVYYRQILQKNLENEVWDSAEDLMYNISNVLEMTIPTKLFSDDVDLFEPIEEKECAICFEWRSENEIPNEVCETPTCRSLYHSKCLFTYFSSYRKFQEFFGKIQGECPNCDAILSCSIPNFY